jgi:hypothetical protein
MSRKKPKHSPKRVRRLPELDFAKSAVLNTLRSTSDGNCGKWPGVQGARSARLNGRKPDTSG